MKSNWDVIVVGAGAAGLYAAATAAERGRRTLLIEKNRKLGVKILMSGGTRCNITHNATWQEIADAFGKRQGRFLKFALATLPPEQIVQVFHNAGVETKVEETGKVFPVSNKAIDVRDALVERARKAGAAILNEAAVTSMHRIDDRFKIKTDHIEAGMQNFDCESLILTTGGQSYPGCGTTGDGYVWLKELGHRVVAARPALTPVRVNEAWVRDLSGVTITDMTLRVRLIQEGKQKPIERDSCRSSFLFTHKGCSGPSVLNVSRVITDPNFNVGKILVCDWLPDFNEQQLREQMTADSLRSSGKQLGNWLSQQIPKRLATVLCENANVSFEQSFAELGRKSLSGMINQIKQTTMPIDGTLGFAKAEVTAGGVALDEVKSKTMASKLVPGLFLAGEILDVDGPIGGYNFQAAFSTGFVAGSNA